MIPYLTVHLDVAGRCVELRSHRRRARPSWVDEDELEPDPSRYVESECFVAGAISTLPPFMEFHPAWALPVARQALYALSEWEPSDG